LPDTLPNFVQGRKTLTVTGFDLYGQDVTRHHLVGNQAAWDAATTDLKDPNKQAFAVTIAPDPPGPAQVLTRDSAREVFLIIRYMLEP
jgi:hypothetical protein